MRFDRFVKKLAIAALVCGWVCEGAGGSGVPVRKLPFRGTATGGTLVLANTRNRGQQYVSIKTAVGEPAESVARRLVDAINDWNASPPATCNALWGGSWLCEANGGTVILPHGYWALAGTEEGLGIPKPVLSLSCWYEKASDKIHLKWMNPPGGYDSIRVYGFRGKGRDIACSPRLVGSATSLTMDRGIIDVNWFDAHVIGYRDAIPSNSAGILLGEAGCCQSEVYDIPFSGGVAPSWSIWTTGSKPDRSAFAQGQKYDGQPGALWTLLGKPLYQAIRAPKGSTVHGIRRKFLGLTGGHTYRLTCALTTLKMDLVKGDWELAVCAVPNQADGNDFTAQQLAGLARLPDGRKGPEAGRIFQYGPGNTTKGIWEVALTGHKPFLKCAAPHITLPEDANTLTVWVRFTSADPNGEIGFSGVKLADVTAAGGRLKPPNEVIEKEREEQALFLRGLAGAKEKAARRKNAE